MPDPHFSEQVMSRAGEDTFVQIKRFGNNGKIQCSGYLRSSSFRQIMVIPMTEDGRLILKSTPVATGEPALVQSGLVGMFDITRDIAENVRTIVHEKMQLPVINLLRVFQAPVFADKTNIQILQVIAVVSDFTDTSETSGYRAYHPDELLTPKWGIQDQIASMAIAQFLSPFALLQNLRSLNAEMMLGFYQEHLNWAGGQGFLEQDASRLSGRRLYDLEEGVRLYRKIRTVIGEVTG